MVGCKSYFITTKKKNNSQLSNEIEAIFSDKKMRILFRPTFLYEKLSMESYHPKILNSEIEYYNFISQLKDKAIKSTLIFDIFNSEKTDLEFVDVPYFYAITNGKDIYD